MTGSKESTFIQSLTHYAQARTLSPRAWYLWQERQVSPMEAIVPKAACTVAKLSTSLQTVTPWLEEERLLYRVTMWNAGSGLASH